MTVTGFKERFRRGVEPLGAALARAGISANQVTAAGAIMSLAAGMALYGGRLRLGLLLVIVGGCCDFIDGAVARAGNTASRFGAFLDSTLDRYGETFLYVGLAGWFMRSGEQLAALASVGALAGSLLVSYARARAEGLGFACSGGVAQRPERLVLLGVGLLLRGSVLSWMIWLIAGLSHVTVVQRMVAVNRQSRRLGSGAGE